MVLRLDIERARRELKERAKKAYKGVYQADITDDGKHIQLHWEAGEMTTLPLQDLLIAYLEKLEVKKE